MAHNVLVNKDNIIVGGAEHDTGAVVNVSDAEFTLLTTAGAFAGGSPLLTDQGEVQNDPADDLYAQAAGPTAVIAMSSAAATGGDAPTEAEYNALRVDVVNTRTYLAALHTALTGAGKPFSS